MQRSRLALIGVLALLVLLHLPLARARPADSSDHVDHYLRVEQYAHELRQGRWPQLLPDPVRGGGHAFPRFYPPLTHLAGATVTLVIGDGVTATHVVATLTLLLSAAALFALLRAGGAAAMAAALGAIAYGTMPYQYTLLYVRGAFAEATLFLWLPLLLLGVWRAFQERQLPRWWPLVLGATILTHTALSLWAIPLLAIVVLLAFPPRLGPALARPVAVAGLLASGLAMAYVLPMLDGLGSVRAGDPEVLWATAAHLGETLDRLANPISLVVLEAALAVGAVIALWRLRGGSDTTRRLLAATVLMQALVVGMIVAPSSVWNLVPQPLLYIQFPWRLSSLVVFLVSLAIGLTTARFTTPTGRKVVVVCIALLVLAAVPRSVMTARDMPTVTRAQVHELLSMPYADHGLTQMGDYLPRDIRPQELALAIDHTRDSLVKANGVEGWRRTADGATAELRLNIRSSVRLPLVGYPDLYRVVDGPERALVAVSEVQGLLAVDLEAGNHRLEVVRKLPRSTSLGLAIAALALLATLSVPRAWLRLSAKA